jgi:hypothetical protein
LGQGVKLSTGTEVPAFKNVLGIDEAGNIFEGYDDSIETKFDASLDAHVPALVPAEMAELADIMIARWQDYKDNAQKYFDRIVGDYQIEDEVVTKLIRPVAQP